MSDLTSDPLEKAREVEMKAKKLTEAIAAPQVEPGKMAIKIAFTNRRETPDLKLA